LGAEQTDFVAIPQSAKLLTLEMMQSIWNQIDIGFSQDLIADV